MTDELWAPKAPPMVVYAATAIAGMRYTPNAKVFGCHWCEKFYPSKEVVIAHSRDCVLAHPEKVAAHLAAQTARGREDLARKADPAGIWRP